MTSLETMPARRGDPLGPMRVAAAAQLGTPVIDAALFARHGGDGAAGAGGLPARFLLAVTTDEVVALERDVPPGVHDSAGMPGAEVARWRRADLQVDVRDEGRLLRVTLASPATGETIRCTVGRIAATVDFVALLDDPSRQLPARPW